MTPLGAGAGAGARAAAQRDAAAIAIQSPSVSPRRPVSVLTVSSLSEQRRVAVGERAHELGVKMVGALAHRRRHALLVEDARARDLAAEPRRQIALAAAGDDGRLRDTA